MGDGEEPLYGHKATPVPLRRLELEVRSARELSPCGVPGAVMFCVGERGGMAHASEAVSAGLRDLWLSGIACVRKTAIHKKLFFLNWYLKIVPRDQ